MSISNFQARERASELLEFFKLEEAAVKVNPVTHLVTSVRGLMAGTLANTEIGWVLLTSAILLILFAPLAMYFCRNKG